MSDIDPLLLQEYKLVAKYEPKFNANPSLTIYHGVLYREDDMNGYMVGLEITIPEGFPNKPPRINFKANISHSKIKNGIIHHDFFTNWSDKNHIWQVIKVIRGLFEVEPPIQTNRRTITTVYQEDTPKKTEEEKRSDKINLIYLRHDKIKLLADLVLEFCNKINQEIDHIIEFKEFFSLFREYYNTDLVSPDDLIETLRILEEKKLIVGLKEYLKNLYIEISSFTLSKDVSNLLVLLKNRIKITTREIIVELNWDVLKTRKVLSILEKLHILRKVEKYSTGPIWYVVNSESG